MIRVYAALLSLSFIWGISFVFIKLLVEPAGVWGTVFLRCAAGALPLLPILFLKRKSLPRSVPWVPLIIVGMINTGLPWGLIALSETVISSSSASILNAATPLWTGLIGMIFFSVSLSGRQWLGLFLGMTGILIFIDFNTGALFQENFTGVGTMLLATLCYGTSAQIVRKYLGNIGVLFTTTISLLIGSAVGLAGMIASETYFVLDEMANGTILVSIIGLGCFGSGIAHLLFFYITKKGGPETAVSVTFLIPVTALLWGALLLQEKISGNAIIGLIVILAGVYLAVRKKKETVPIGGRQM
ncbi:DMT family transporter [Metabacillus mangrovi]|uniref:DMT family transporter n=1 Tax=Metabacillus mangrovi TaxID=1491830 RepID=UPI0012BB16E9|nr:DMT family transporter [Metabacillus mangrovi]